MINITLTGDQVDRVVVDELKLSLELLLDPDGFEDDACPDLILINAIKTTLQYFMPPHEADEYLAEISALEVNMMVQIASSLEDTHE